MLDDNVDRFAFSLGDIKPDDFTGEPMQINLPTKPSSDPLKNWGKWSGTLSRRTARNLRLWDSFSAPANQLTHVRQWWCGKRTQRVIIPTFGNVGTTVP